MQRYAGPPAPLEGQVFVDPTGGFWKVKRLTVADSPVGFYLVHLCHGPSIAQLEDSLVLGPREFAALLQDRGLTPHADALAGAGEAARRGSNYTTTWTDDTSAQGAVPGGET